MDDAVHVVDSTISARGRRVIRRLQKVSAYGSGLQLLRTVGDAAFGFRWRGSSGRLIVSQDTKWVKQFEKVYGGVVPKAFVYGGKQLDNGRQRVGIIAGHLLRLLDTTNDDEATVLNSVRRIFVAFLEAGHLERYLRRAALRSREAILRVKHCCRSARLKMCSRGTRRKGSCSHLALMLQKNRNP